VSTIILYLDEKSLDFVTYMSLLLYIYACACTFGGRGAYVMHYARNFWRNVSLYLLLIT